MTPTMPRGRQRSFLRDNGLSLVTAGLFAAFLLAQSIAGHRAFNEEQREHHETELTYLDYLGSSHFSEATFENWESEFLQMALYVFLTAIFFQRGSAESNDPDEAEPSPSRRHGAARFLYENSLSIAFAVLFLASFALHAWSGAARYDAEQRSHGQPQVGPLGYLGTAQFWFESFQNWQSEFLAILAMVVLSIFLRQRGSPESKPVEAPHGATGA